MITSSSRHLARSFAPASGISISRSVRQTVLTTAATNITRCTVPRRQFHSNKALNGRDLDDLCKKHMLLPSDEFAIGCSFLHKVALGNVQEVQLQVLNRKHLVNFRDYDRRTPLHIAASEGHLHLVKVCRKIISFFSFDFSSLHDVVTFCFCYNMDYNAVFNRVRSEDQSKRPLGGFAARRRLQA